MTLLNIFPRLLPRAVDTNSVRWAARVLGAGVFICVLLGAVAHGSDAPVAAEPEPDATAPEMTAESALPSSSVSDASAAAHDGEPTAAQVEAPAEDVAMTSEHAESTNLTEQPALPPHESEVAVRANVGLTFWKLGDVATAERAFADALSYPGFEQEKRALLLTMADLYEGIDDSVKAIGVLESLLRGFPQDPELPAIMMRVGNLYRSTGAYDSAINRYYQVLNSTLRGGTTGFDASRRVAMKVRLEIADTYLLKGALAEARTYYTRLQLLDLEPADRERVKFRGAQLQYSLDAWLPAEQELAAFIAAYPQSVFVPEARYMRARALKELKRRDEAVQEVLALLRSQDAPDSGFTEKSTAYWKRRTGNELANNFYEQGDFLGALAIYQALARASSEPAWRWPAIYQVGLCFERLQLPRRAAEAYRVIVQPEAPAPAGRSLPETLASLQSMAQWRLEHLDWIEGFEQRLHALSAGDPADA